MKSHHLSPVFIPFINIGLLSWSHVIANVELFSGGWSCSPGSLGATKILSNDGGPEIIYRYRASTKTKNGFTYIKTHVKMFLHHHMQTHGRVRSGGERDFGKPEKEEKKMIPT